jgi:hypothetical protein
MDRQVRLTSGFWVGAYVRRCHAAGAFAVVARRGAEEAGAIFLRIDKLDGRIDLYGPLPQMMLDAGSTIGRQFEILIADGDGQSVGARLDREMRFDPDLWIVDVEDRSGRAHLG